MQRRRKTDQHSVFDAAFDPAAAFQPQPDAQTVGGARQRSASRRDPSPALDPMWFQEPLNRRETYEAPRTLISEIAIIGQISLQRAVPRAMGPGSHPNEFELHLVRDGRMRLWIDSPKRVFELHGGMASLTLPGQIHSGESELMLPGRWMWLQFRVPVAGGRKPTEARVEMPGLSARDSAAVRDGLSAIRPPVFHFSPALEQCMERLIGEHRHPTPESPMAARGILHELIAWVIRDHRAEMSRRTSSRETDGYSPPITKAIEWLRTHLDQSLSIGDLAEVAGLSESYFRRWFHREVGSSPSDYVTRMRIERSKQLLAETDRTITQVAMEMGYNTSAYFTAAFHRETGTTPSDFRRQIRASKPEPLRDARRRGYEVD